MGTPLALKPKIRILAAKRERSSNQRGPDVNVLTDCPLCPGSPLEGDGATVNSKVDVAEIVHVAEIMACLVIRKPLRHCCEGEHLPRTATRANLNHW